MIITCYSCHQPFVIRGWNPTRQTVTCPTATCGHPVHVGEAAERVYGERTGRLVKERLARLENLKGRDDHTVIIELAARRVESLMDDAERALQIESQGDVVARVLGGVR